jgi:hypothetical protein
LARIEVKSGTISFVLPLFLFCVENHICFSHGVHVVGAAWRAVMRIMAEIWDLVQRTVDGHTGRVLGGWTIRRSDDDVCSLHRAHEDE